MNNYGKLLNKDILLHRQYFNEMVKLIGINTIYKAPRTDKHYDDYGEIHSNYYEPVVVGCIFDEHPAQQTLKKLNWVSELQENASLIHVPYDLEHLQQGALFIVPDTFDETKGRVFRVVKMSGIMIYPASITCEIVPEYENTFEESQYTHKDNTFSVLTDENTGILLYDEREE